MDGPEESAVLAVRDVARAVATFRDVLGLDVVEDLGWMARVGVPGGPQVLVVAEDVAVAAADGQEPAVIRVA